MFLNTNLLAAIQSVRNNTFNATCTIKTFGTYEQNADGQAGNVIDLGPFECRIDALVSDDITNGGNQFPNTYLFGLTIANDAPSLPVGTEITIDGLTYKIDRTQDAKSEIILRRYVMSISAGEWKGD